MNIFFTALEKFATNTAFYNLSIGNIILILLGFALIYVSVFKEYAPFILLPFAIGLIVGNIPLMHGLNIRIDEDGSMFNLLFKGTSSGFFSSLIFLGIGTIVDFAIIISNPKLILISIATQLAIFIGIIAALTFGFKLNEASSIGIIAVVDTPLVVFLSSKISPEMLMPLGFFSLIFIAMLPAIQGTIAKTMVNEKERIIKMKPARAVSKKEKVILILAVLLISSFIAPASILFLGMMMLGNIIRESIIIKNVSDSIRTSILDIVLVFFGFTIGLSAEAHYIFKTTCLIIFFISLIAFILGSIAGVFIVKLMNKFLDEENKINPLIGIAGASASFESSKIAQKIGKEYEQSNHLKVHAMGANLAAIICSALIAGILLSIMA